MILHLVLQKKPALDARNPIGKEVRLVCYCIIHHKCSVVRWISKNLVDDVHDFRDGAAGDDDRRR